MEKSKTKKKSSLIKDAFVLFLITLVSGLSLGCMYEITKAPIEARELEAKLAAYQKVYSEADSLSIDEQLMQQAAEVDLESLDPSYTGVTIDEVNKAFDTSDTMIGYVAQVTTTECYGEYITLAIGYSLDGTVKGVEMLYIGETPGLGMKADQPEFKDQYAQKKVNQFIVTKSGATDESEIDSISGATITSKGVTNAVNAGIGFFSEYSTELGGGSNE